MNTEPTGPFPPDADGCICPQDFVIKGCPVHKEDIVDSQARRTAHGIEPRWPAELWWCIQCGEPTGEDPCQFCGNAVVRYRVVPYDQQSAR